MKIILAIIMLAAISQPVVAQTAETSAAQPVSQTDIKRWSLEAGVGGLLAYVHGRVAYRLPVLDDKLMIFADFAPLESEYDLFPGRFQTAMIGARYYLDPVGPSSLYFALGAGASFNLTGAVHPNDAQRTTGFLPALFPYLGVGIDYMFTPSWGLNTQVGVAFVVPRAEVNLKYLF